MRSKIVAIQDSANAESNKNQSCEAPKSRPLRGAKKSGARCKSVQPPIFC
ncbi:hypothetical protein [Helicobacter sp. 23-1045]